jgi:hypothetical protein
MSLAAVDMTSTVGPKTDVTHKDQSNGWGVVYVHHCTAGGNAGVNGVFVMKSEHGYTTEDMSSGTHLQDSERDLRLLGAPVTQGLLCACQLVTHRTVP